MGGSLRGADSTKNIFPLARGCGNQCNAGLALRTRNYGFPFRDPIGTYGYLVQLLG